MTANLKLRQLTNKRPRLQYIAGQRLHCPILEFKRVETSFGVFYWDQTKAIPGALSGLLGGVFGFLAGTVAGFQVYGGFGGFVFGLLGCALGCVGAALAVVRVK